MKRRIVILLVFVLLGAIVNIAVAWTLALSVPLYDGPNRRGQRWVDGTLWELQDWSNATGVGLYSARLHIPGQIEEGFGPDPRDFIPRWAGLKTPTARFASGTSYGVEVREADARGWPFIAMWSEIEWLPGRAEEVRGGIRTALSPWHRGDARIPRVLPLRVVLPGFSLNTLFYAALLWLLVATVGALRRSRRIRRGLCPACAYPIGASNLCTECGMPVSPITRVGAFEAGR